MKKILLLAIAALILIAGALANQLATKVPQTEIADAHAGALEYVNATLPRMITNWDESAWLNNLNITKKSFWNTQMGKSTLVTMVRNYNTQLGRMTSIESAKQAPAETAPTEAEGPVKISASGESVFNVKAKYITNASFERGKATLTVGIGKATGEWKIEQIAIHIIREPITPPPPSTSNQ